MEDKDNNIVDINNDDIQNEDVIEKINFINFIKNNKKKILYVFGGIIIFIILIYCLSITCGEKLVNENFKNLKFNSVFSCIGTVCIDPGHGGEVPITAPDLQEKEKVDTLNLCLLLKDKLIDKNVKVVMTRDEDIEVSLEERAEIANDNKCDLFLSIHRNISDVGSKVNGIEVWLAYNKDENSDVYGEYIHNALLDSHIQSDRGIRYGSMTNPKENYKVNELTTMPSCLIELGFMTNDLDNEYYDTYMDEYAEKLSEAIVKTLNVINENK